MNFKKLIKLLVIIPITFISGSPNNEQKAIQTRKLHCGGPLFNNKDLIGNLYFAEALFKVSKGRYTCNLPQIFEEQRSINVGIIKNADLKNLRDADGGLFNFDGNDLDSGSVVEFIQSKSLDKPTVILRSDFRTGGDAYKRGGDPWNLMISNYPRTKIIIIQNILAKYQELHNKHNADPHKVATDLSEYLAQQVVSALDYVFASSKLPLPKGMTEKQVYDWYNTFNNLNAE